MNDSDFFGLGPYHVLLAGCGLVIIAAYWLPRFVSGREPAASGLLILGGFAVFGFLPGMPEAFAPIDRPVLWEVASEFAVIVALFGTGLRIDRLADFKVWRPATGLLLIGMPLCLLAVTLLGVMAGLGLASAILLAAVLAPTDPVLAADVQVGPPLEGGEHPVRFALTSEAGLNDGLAFPFVYLAILLAAGNFDMAEWAGIYVFYKIIVGALAGAGAGWLLGRIMFALPRGSSLSETGSGVVAFAGVLFTYGACELVEGYGFIAVFAMGLVLRRCESEHEFHRKLHDFSESLEHAVTAILLVMLGGALPILWPHLDWQIAAVGLALIFVIRPVAGMLSLTGSALTLKQRGVVAFYGVRGLGSIYYLAYAATHAEFTRTETLWAVVAFTILASTIIHGFTAGSVVWAVTHDEDA
ncbi:cation:proton antiporter [Pacificimonas sp. WHA3]|uniref:Cation:proton antiporter n=1 Tax=Pacificimonas pallii TaxID=2827236 RepID=A0ABS6SBA9_9SPHN|nr:cation:proton antiporter [Pacificimonas pallii]MBV7255704.1 cation:proton antiporter [Pacificimonas pallii]